MDTWLLQNPYRSTGALHFRDTPAGLGYGVQVNTTGKQVRGVYEKENFKHQLPLQVAAERELARFLAADWSIDWTPRIAEFSHPPISTFSAVGTVGPTFLFAAALFGFVTLIGNIVLERELKLRQAMTTMGLLDSAYWSTWFVWEVLLAVLSSLLLCLFGMMMQFSFFLDNGFFVVFLMFFLFQLCMIPFAFLLSNFLSKSGSATSLGFLIFLIGFITQLVVQFGVPYSTAFDKESAPKSSTRLKGKSSNTIFILRIIFNLFPPNLLAIGLQYLGNATGSSTDNGIKWSRISECSIQDPDCVLTMSDIYVWLISLTLVYLVLALYVDNVVPDANGVRKPFYFCFLPSFWLSKVKASEGGGCCSCVGRPPPVPPLGGPEDEDVMAEKNAIQSGSRGREATALELHGLVKSFGGKTECKGCCLVGKKPFHAVKGSWLSVEENTVFCLLGPNGAGKSTTINCLTGIIPTTSGQAYIYGKSVRSPSEMNSIRSFMGVCPQFDILWDGLTGEEHLRMFASIKGLKPALITQEVDKLLKEVQLQDSATVRSGSYSGGMKRRLSVAIALIGDPKIVFLDEPTTGMDPITRRSVWDVIEKAKRGRAIVLTTHSMEEADILGDRIGIMAKGRLRCLGTSIHLKNKFGTGYIINISVRSAQDNGTNEDVEKRAAKVKDFFFNHLEIQPTEETKAYIQFVVPRTKEAQLSRFFTDLREKKEKLGYTDLQLSLTTLEEVFLNIVRTSELETAQAEDRYETITLQDGTELNVPVGAQYVRMPSMGSGPEHEPAMVVEISWLQDDSGVLRVSQHSEPKALPQGVLNTEVSEAKLDPKRKRKNRRASRRELPSNNASVV